jgi:predicted transcriptional regulator of viral defense system
MTLKGHGMFSNYIKKLRASGRYYFTINQAMKDLKASANKIKSAVYTMKKSGDLISPAKGLYIIVPPEHKLQGSIPSEELVPILMKYLNFDYYAGLLTASLYYGASHQKPASFQIVSNKRIKHPLKFGLVNIDLIYKKSLAISSPELTVMDLFLYPNRSGGLNHIATVLSELIESIKVEKLIKLASSVDKIFWMQRLGYILEKIDVMNNEMKLQITNRLADYLSSKKLRFIPLASEIAIEGSPRSEKWKVIENITIESD